MASDSYKTIAKAQETTYRQLSSKFLVYAYPVETEAEIKEHLDALRKRWFDATHHCYAWRLGAHGEHYRANDDGEPSSTAGKPILGQLLSQEITNCLVVVVRYFGGTKLGVPGLIAAYKESTAQVLAECEIVERTVDVVVEVSFSYIAMNDVMRIVKDMQPRILEQLFDNLCTMRLSIRESDSQQLMQRLEKVEGATVEVIA
ncbi:MAG: YigZ family protein [Rikenellaceae bacterium]|nr:YigZ family protein [Rikenellaceae bacterium]